MDLFLDFNDFYNGLLFEKCSINYSFNCEVWNCEVLNNVKICI